MADSSRVNKFVNMKTRTSLPGNLPSPIKPPHNTLHHRTQRSDHHKLIELRHSSKSRTPSMRGPPRIHVPASVQQRRNETISQPAEKDLAEVNALANELSSTQIDRSLSQMEINELQKYFIMHRVRNIAILKVMLKYMTDIKELKAKILEQMKTINNGVETMKNLQNIINQMGQNSTDIENPRHFLEQLKNETLKLTIVKTQLMQELIQCYQDLKDVGLVYMNAQNPDIDKKMKYAVFLVTTNKKLNQQVVQLKAATAELRLDIKQEELSGNEYELLLAEENLKMSILKERIFVLSNEIQKIKGELGETKGPIKDIMNVLKDYLYAESYRKSLAYQKRWLLGLLNNCQKRKGQDNQNNQRLLFKHKEDGLNSEGLWRAGGFAVVAVFRLRYLVEARTKSHLFEVKTIREALVSS